MSGTVSTDTSNLSAALNDPNNIITNNLVPNILKGSLPGLPNLNNLYILYLPPGVQDDVCFNNEYYAYHSSIFLGGPPWNLPPTIRRGFPSRGTLGSAHAAVLAASWALGYSAYQRALGLPESASG
jgi:hypothetical protein